MTNKEKAISLSKKSIIAYIILSMLDYFLGYINFYPSKLPIIIFIAMNVMTFIIAFGKD